MQINGVFNRFLKNKKKAFKWIDNSFLSEDQKEGYKAIITERYERL
jgi:serine/threonine-protein kinase HipA